MPQTRRRHSVKHAVASAPRGYGHRIAKIPNGLPGGRLTHAAPTIKIGCDDLG